MKKMNWRKAILLYVVSTILAWAAIWLLLPSSAEAGSKSKTMDIRNRQNVKVGDIFKPAYSGTAKIRDRSGYVRGYIKSNGTITNRRNQKIGKISK